MRCGLQVGSLGVYEGALRRAVLRFKDGNDRQLTSLLSERLALLLGQRGVEQAQLVGVPTCARRLRWRGYCGPQRLARSLAERLGWPVLQGLKCPGDPAARKFLKGFSARRKQVPHFTFSGYISGIVVLIDDVVTSGATLRAARELLLRSGAQRVELLCLARSQTIN